jgi:deoxyribodipyrimidine photo-lyase
VATPHSDRPVLLWLRDDLRIADNPALSRAVESGRPVVALFVFDDVSPDLRPLGGASRWWLHRSLDAFGDRFARLGGRLCPRRGPAAEIVAAVAEEIDAASVLWNRRYLPAQTAIDAELKRRLRAEGRVVESFQANLLHEPHTVKTGAGGPFRVFTPFWRAARGTGAPRAPLPPPRAIRGAAAPPPSPALDDLDLLPRAPYWAAGLDTTWTPGEEGATARLDRFLAEGLRGYATGRDRPDLDHTSRLSPHLRFGEISPFAIAAAVAVRVAADPTLAVDADKFLAEIGWREFAHHLAFHFGDLSQREFQPRYESFPWTSDEAFLEAWRRGRTGYPLVDAGMRELWATGTMHNRVRMVAASFLVKHGLVDWREGERWFFDTLVDACPAVNPASWQWVAGCGADAAPFFRIFNPVAQSVKFDPDGAYLRRWLPELAGLPAGSIHAPWAASAVPAAAYPAPIVDHAFARGRALAALAGDGNG